jgi:dienelactone hydrolase
VPQDTRIHYTITDGGDQPNIVPAHAESFYYIRHYDANVVRDVFERVKKAGEGAALATGTTFSYEIVSGSFGTLPNDTLGRIVDANLRRVGGYHYTPEEERFAQAIAKTLPPVPANAGPSAIGAYELGHRTSASSDVGDISWVVPTSSLGAATWVAGTAPHSWQAAAASGTSIGVDGALVAAKTLALSGAQLLLDPASLAAAKAELRRSQGADFHYAPLLGDRKPALDYTRAPRAERHNEGAGHACGRAGRPVAVLRRSGGPACGKSAAGRRACVRFLSLAQGVAPASRHLAKAGNPARRDRPATGRAPTPHPLHLHRGDYRRGRHRRFGRAVHSGGHSAQGGWPLVTWGHGTVGVADICAPSWQGRSWRDIRYLNRWLAEGFAVVATDYQGLGTAGGHPLLNNRVAAYGILDAVRAARAADPSIANRVVIVGQSQGGAGAFAAAAYAPSYAPDVHVLGTVATGVIYNPPGVKRGQAADLDKVDETISYSFFSVLSAIQHDASVDPAKLFTPDTLPLVDQARTTCLFSLEGDVTLFGLTRRGTFLPAWDPVSERWFAQTVRYPTFHLTSPIFIGAGASDGSTTATTQIAIARAACEAGSTVEAHVYAGKDHSGAVNRSLDDSIPFVRRLLSGETVAGNCAALPS